VTGRVVLGFLDAGQWSASFGLSLRDLCMFDVLGPQHIVRQHGRELRQMCGTGGISEGRNEVAKAFLDTTDGDWLWFIDTDMGFAPDTVQRLVRSADKYKRPVMGGLCFAQRRTATPLPGNLHAPQFAIIPTCYAYTETDDEAGFIPIREYGRDTVIQVAATGAACLLIHRRALEKVRSAYGDAWFDPITHPAALSGGRRVFSEDLSFCVRCQAADIPVHVDTAVKTSHEKGGIYLTEELYDRQQAAAALAAQDRAVPEAAEPAAVA
jgi:hypothetical protein